MSPPHRHLVVSAMRNEGAFLLEWVAWYRMLGFDDILILTNDCTDHSPHMLAILQDAGLVTWVTHVPRPGRPPKRSAHRAARAHPLVAAADWLLVVDVDEFLVIHDGGGRLTDFLGDDTPDARVVAVNWRCFGTAGLTRWTDGLVHRTHLRAAPSAHRANAFFKSFVWRPRDFDRLGEHGPRGFAEPWGARPNVMVDANGRVMSDFDPETAPISRRRPEAGLHANAQINHYITRTRENFEFKRGRPSASAHADRYTDAFLDRYDRNEVEDRAALRYRADFDAAHAELTALPELVRLHHLSCADYVVELARKQGRDGREDERYVYHMDLAGGAG